MSVRVSVIVPWYGDRGGLDLCLAALSRQTFPQSDFEILVVDNHPDGAAAVGERTPSQGARWLREAKPGSYAARNTGLRAARGALIGFTDADCVPDRTWIERGAARLDALESPAIIGGRIEITCGDPTHPNLFELYDQVLGFGQRRYVTKDGVAATANLFTHRAAFEAAGPFDDRLLSGGDAEWSRRAVVAGARILYAEDLLVQHPARASLMALVRKAARTAGGAAVLSGPGWRRIPADISYELRGAAFRLRQIVAAPLAVPDRARLVPVLGALTAVRALERTRVHLGGMPRRR